MWAEQSTAHLLRLLAPCSWLVSWNIAFWLYCSLASFRFQVAGCSCLATLISTLDSHSPSPDRKSRSLSVLTSCQIPPGSIGVICCSVTILLPY